MGKATYEVHIRRDGRWTIEATFDDEESAVLLARAEVGARGAEEVKVLKYRPFAGFEVEVSVFHRKAPEAKGGAIAMGGGPDGAPVCREASELRRLEARIVATRMLRNFLDKHQITVTELLHSWSFARRLDEEGGLLRAVISAVARWQAETLGIDVKERTQALTQFCEQTLTRLRNYNAERKKLSQLDWNDLGRARRRLLLEAPEGEGDFLFLAQLTDKLQCGGGLLAKLDQLIDPWEETADEQVAGLLEMVIADALNATEVVRELLGPQPSLGAGLAALADLLLGRPPMLDGAPVHPLMARICRLAAEGRAPECRAVLIERIRASLAGDQPLDRRDARNEISLIGVLEQRLLGPDGKIIGGAPVAKALTQRGVRYRQAILRNSGMHDVADAVGSSRWKP